MKVILNVLLMVALLTLSACSPKQADAPKNTQTTTATEAKTQTESKTEGQTTPSKKSETTSQSDANAKLIASSKDDKVKLYAVNKIDSDVHRVRVDINGNQKEFDWNILNTGTKPQVFYTDLTGDGKEEAAIIINTGRGTGLDTFDIHILNAKDLSEIKVQNYEKIVANQIETHVVKHDDTLTIAVKTKEKKYNFKSNIELAPNYKQDKLAFGGVVIYELENQKIVSKIGASVGASPQYVGNFHIIYKFDTAKNEFVADQIKFVPNEK